VSPQLELFAQSLASDDVVALEATSGAGLIVDLLERHVARVLVANTRKLPQISRAKAKTDRLDARTLAKLAATGMLETVWAPDEQTRALRRVCARRESLVRARTRAKNEAHARIGDLHDPAAGLQTLPHPRSAAHHLHARQGLWPEARRDSLGRPRRPASNPRR